MTEAISVRDMSPNRTTVQPPERDSVGVAPGCPDKHGLEFAVPLHRPEVFPDVRLNALPRSLPSVLLRNSAGKSVHGERPLAIDDAVDESTQNRCVVRIEEPMGIGGDILLTRARGLTCESGTAARNRFDPRTRRRGNRRTEVRATGFRLVGQRREQVPVEAGNGKLSYLVCDRHFSVRRLVIPRGLGRRRLHDLRLVARLLRAFSFVLDRRS